MKKTSRKHSRVIYNLIISISVIFRKKNMGNLKKRDRIGFAIAKKKKMGKLQMYVKQLFWILICYFAGYLLSEGLGLPIPANVLGLLFLLLLLVLRLVALSDVEKVSDIIIGHLALIFLPSAVGIMEYFGLLQASFLKIMIPWMMACIVGYAVTGWVTQAAIRAQERRVSASYDGGQRGCGGLEEKEGK